MHTHSIAVTRSAHYVTLGPDDGPLDEAWMVVHGYGQLARYFLRPFEAIATPHRLIVAPEALSRFYLDTPHRRVGASWMTREDRIAEITDYVTYLDAVFAEVCARAEADPQQVRLTALGFSQGTATVSRWLDQSPLLAPSTRRADRLLLWGGALPHDLDLTTADWLRDVDLTLVAGEQDRFVSAETIATQETALREADLPYQVLRYEGGHRIEPDVLRQLNEATDD